MLDNHYVTFLELAKQLNYTRTAEKLSLTQPTVTKHIQAIEEDLKIKLFTYKNKTLSLSEDGHYLVEELSLITNKINEIKQYFSRKSNQNNLIIGASHTIGEYFIPKYTNILSQDFHQFSYHLIIENHAVLLNKLNNQEIDCALISGPLDKKGEYNEYEFYCDEIVLICNQNHPFAHQKVRLSDLDQETFVLRETDSGLYQSLHCQLKAQNYSIDSFNNVSHIGNISLISHIIQQQNKLSFFYRSTIENDLKSGQIAQIYLPDIDLTQRFVLIYNPKLIEKSSIASLLNLLKVNTA